MNDHAVVSAPTRLDRALFFLCAGLTLVALSLPKYLPMTDLPQHAAQVSIWKHLSDPGFGFDKQFELHWLSPYLAGYVLSRPLVDLFGIRVGLKILVAAVVLLFPLTLDRLLAAADGDRRLAIVGFPLAFGFSFYWGFLNFLVALPLGLLLLAHAYRYARCPSRRGALLLGVGALALYFCHVMVFLFISCCASLVIAAQATGARSAIRRAAPLLCPVPLALLWSIRTWTAEPLAHTPVIWRLGWQRLIELPSTLLGYRHDNQGAITGLIVLVALILARVRPRRNIGAWAPCALGILAFLALPASFSGTFQAYSRFAVFIVPLSLTGTTVPSSPREGKAGRILLAVVSIAWIGLLIARFHNFDADARQFDLLKDRMEPNRRVLALTFAPTSDALPGGPFLQFAAWYQAEKGGVLGFSFASLYPEMARYRPGAAPRMSPGLEWYPERFDWSTDGGYDYFVVRSWQDVGPKLVAGAPRPIVLTTHVGAWWLYSLPQAPSDAASGATSGAANGLARR